MFEQPFFTPDFSCVADQLAAFSYYAMAGEENRKRVSVVGKPNGSGGFRVSDASGDRSVACGDAAGELAQFGPNALLKFGTVGREWRVEAF